MFRAMLGDVSSKLLARRDSYVEPATTFAALPPTWAAPNVASDDDDAFDELIPFGGAGTAPAKNADRTPKTVVDLPVKHCAQVRK